MNKDELIKATILGEEHLGENLKGLCIEYIDNLQQENQKYKEAIDKLNDLLIIKKARCLNEDNYVLNVPDLDDILQVLKEVE